MNMVYYVCWWYFAWTKFKDAGFKTAHINLLQGRPLLAFFYVTQKCIKSLKTLDIFCNCKRPVFSLGFYSTFVCTKFILNWSSKLRDNNWRKSAIVAQVDCFQMLYFKTSKSNYEVSKSNSNTIWVRNYFCLNSYYFRGSQFSQCFILSTALRCLLPSKFLC